MALLLGRISMAGSSAVARPQPLRLQKELCLEGRRGVGAKREHVSSCSAGSKPVTKCSIWNQTVGFSLSLFFFFLSSFHFLEVQIVGEIPSWISAPEVKCVVRDHCWWQQVLSDLYEAE